MSVPNYDKVPTFPVPGNGQICVQGWDAIAERLRQAMTGGNGGKIVLTVECYTGVDESQILEELKSLWVAETSSRNEVVDSA